MATIYLDNHEVEILTQFVKKLEKEHSGWSGLLSCSIRHSFISVNSFGTFDMVKMHLLFVRTYRYIWKQDSYLVLSFLQSVNGCQLHGEQERNVGR